MKRFMSLVLLCSMVVGMNASDMGTADADKSCNSCNTCEKTTCSKPCNSCNTCGCKTTLTEEEENAGEQRCACNKPKPGSREVGTTDAEKCCNSSNTCETTTCSKPCNSCNTCGCKTTLTEEEENAGEQRCACSKPKPVKKALAEVAVANAMDKAE